MKPKVMVITGRTLSGKKGIRYEHTLKIGTIVKVSDGSEGEIVGKGMAGMLEVKFADGSTCLYAPGDLEILGENTDLDRIGPALPALLHALQARQSVPSASSAHPSAPAPSPQAPSSH